MNGEKHVPPWKQTNDCGLCWCGPCLCVKYFAQGGVKDTRHKIIPSGKHLLTFGKDYSDPSVQAEVDASTAAFIREMRYISGRKNGDVGSGKT